MSCNDPEEIIVSKGKLQMTICRSLKKRSGLSKCAIAIGGLVAMTVTTAHSFAAQSTQAQVTENGVTVDSRNGATGEKRAGMIPNPETRIDLLKNVKAAFDARLVLQPTFYTEQNLREYFGGDPLFMAPSADGKSQRGAILYRFGPDENAIRPNNFLYVSIRFVRDELPGGPRAFWLVSVPKYPRFEDLMEIFGTGWKKAPYPAHTVEPNDPRVPYQPPAYSVPQHKMGHRAIEYDYGTDLKVSMSFNLDGSIEIATFTEGK